MIDVLGVVLVELLFGAVEDSMTNAIVERMSRYLDSRQLRALDGPERTALVDAMLFIGLVDGQHTPRERDLTHRTAARAHEDAAELLLGSLPRVRTALESSESRTALLLGLGEGARAPAIREAIFKAGVIVACADGAPTPETLVGLEELRTALEVPTPVADAIAAWQTTAPGLRSPA